LVFSEEIGRMSAESLIAVGALDSLNPEVVQHDPLATLLVEKRVEGTNSPTNGFLKRSKSIPEIWQGLRL
jgi:hypothetical protein